MITFYSKRNNGGYGDRIVGMSAACTVARCLGMKFQVVTDDVEGTHHYFVNQKRPQLLEIADLRTLWKDKHIVFEANTPIDLCLWSNPFFPELKDVSYERESIHSYKEVSQFLFPSFVPTQRFACGVQVRCGDTYCMPHQLAEEYISKENFQQCTESIHECILRKGIRGKIFVTSDTYTIYPWFDALSTPDIQYVYTPRKDDIHYDFYNADSRRDEIVLEHQQLQQCDHIITGLRSNFGITAAYCSRVCQRITLYPTFTTFDTSVDFVSKEFPYKANP